MENEEIESNDEVWVAREVDGARVVDFGPSIEWDRATIDSLTRPVSFHVNDGPIEYFNTDVIVRPPDELGWGEWVQIVDPTYINIALSPITLRNAPNTALVLDEMRERLNGYCFRAENKISDDCLCIFPMTDNITVGVKGVKRISETKIGPRGISNNFKVGDIICGNFLANNVYSHTGEGAVCIVKNVTSYNLELIMLTHKHGTARPFSIWHVSNYSIDDNMLSMLFDKIGKINADNPIKVNYLPPSYDDDRVCIFRDICIFIDHFSSTLARALSNSETTKLEDLISGCEINLDSLLEFVNTHTDIRAREVK